MARPSTADLSLSGGSPFQAPGSGIPASAAPTPLNYAGQPLPPAPAANSTPTPAGLFNAFKRRWVLGSLCGVVAAITVGVAMWMSLPGGKHEARGLIELPEHKSSLLASNGDDYEKYRKKQAFLLKTRDLLNSTVNNPSVSSLDMIRNSEDPVRMLEESLTVTPDGHSFLLVTLKGNNLDDMKPIVDALMKLYVDTATREDYGVREEKIKKLEQMEQKIVQEIDSRRSTIRLLAGATGAMGSDSSTPTQDMLGIAIHELNRKISAKNDEITQLESELKYAEDRLGAFRLVDKSFASLKAGGVSQVVLDKLKPMKDRDFRYRRFFLDELNKSGLLKEDLDQWRDLILTSAQVPESQNPLIPEGEINQRISNHRSVVKLQLERDDIARILEKDRVNAADPESSPVVADWKEKLDKKDREIERAKQDIRDTVISAIKSQSLVNLQNQVLELERRINVSKETRAKWKEETESLQRTRGGMAQSNLEVAQLVKSLVPMEETLGKVRTEIIQNQVQKQMDSRAFVREFAQPLPNNNLNKKMLISGVLGMGTFFLVILMVAYLEWRTRRVDGVDQVVNELGLRIIGTVPVFPNRASLKAVAEVGPANWRFALNEAINSTRTMLLHSARNQSMQVVMVTSATQGEGKTSLASQLATSMATAGMRSLIVDCDLRNPSIHKLFELGLTPGVSEILTQDADPSEAIQPTSVPNLWVIPAGQCSNRVVAALAQGHPLETLFNRLRGQFDFVIVDSCPVLPVADALLIGQHVDGVLFSIMQDISQIPKVALASEKLNQLNIPLLGAVVNGIKQDIYSYGYNYVKQLPA